MTETIRLGTTELPIVPITLGIMRKVGVGSVKSRGYGEDPATREDQWYDGTFEIISAATGKPKTEIEKIQGVNFDQLLEASNKILKLAGLLKEKGDASAGKTGEATG